MIFPRGRGGGYFPILNSGGYAARYLNPKTSMWISADPAVGEYIPVAPNSDEAKEHNENLPGFGGVFNALNKHVYAYAHNNPMKYTDPDGNVPVVAPVIIGIVKVAFAGAAGGAAIEVGVQGISNKIEGKGFFEDLNAKNIGISAGLGAVTGTAGKGFFSLGKKAFDATKAYVKMQGALSKIAEGASGLKGRILSVLRKEAEEKIVEATVVGGVTAGIKNLLKSLFNSSNEKVDDNSSSGTNQNNPCDTMYNH